MDSFLQATRVSLSIPGLNKFIGAVCCECETSQGRLVTGNTNCPSSLEIGEIGTSFN